MALSAGLEPASSRSTGGRFAHFIFESVWWSSAEDSNLDFRAPNAVCCRYTSARRARSTVLLRGTVNVPLTVIAHSPGRLSIAGGPRSEGRRPLAGRGVSARGSIAPLAPVRQPSEGDTTHHN